MAKPVKITETVLRDAHQSLIATRMTTDEMLPIVEKMDKIGYRAVECTGLVVGYQDCSCLKRLTLGILYGTADGCCGVLGRCLSPGKQQYKKARKLEESE